MEDDLEILRSIIQNEYNNNNDIQFGDISIAKTNNTLYFFLDKTKDAEVELYKVDTILELIVGKMHSEHIFAPAEDVDLANNIYESIYKLYREYIKERNYYV